MVAESKNPTIIAYLKLEADSVPFDDFDAFVRVRTEFFDYLRSVV